MMRGRMVHHRDGHTELLRYGRDDSEVIWSVSRGRLNTALIEAAEKAGARFVFDRRLTGATFGDDVALRFENESGDASEARRAVRDRRRWRRLGAARGDERDGSRSASASNRSATATRSSRFPRCRISRRRRFHRSRRRRSHAASASRSSRTRCTSGRAATTCASRCRMPKAASRSRCSCPTKAIRASRPSTRLRRRARCSSATSPTRCR